MENVTGDIVQKSGALRTNVMIMPPPRAARFKTKVMGGFIAVALLIAAFAVVGVVVAIDRGKSLEQLRDHGVVTESIVEKKWRGGGKSKSYYVRYSYFHGGRKYSDDDTMSSGAWRNLVVGSPLVVTVDPADPTHTEIGLVNQATVDRHWTAAIWVGVALGGIAIGAYVFVLLKYLGKRKLLADGVLASARIESIGSPSRKGKMCSVLFAVNAGAGAVENHKRSISQKLLDGLAAGDSIPYLVMPQNPKKGEPLGTVLASCRLD